MSLQDSLEHQCANFRMLTLYSRVMSHEFAALRGTVGVLKSSARTTNNLQPDDGSMSGSRDIHGEPNLLIWN